MPKAATFRAINGGRRADHASTRAKGTSRCRPRASSGAGCLAALRLSHSRGLRPGSGRRVPYSGAPCPALAAFFPHLRAASGPDAADIHAFVRSLAPCGQCRVASQAGRDTLRHMRSRPARTRDPAGSGRSRRARPYGARHVALAQRGAMAGGAVARQGRFCCSGRSHPPRLAKRPRPRRGPRSR